MQCVRVYTFVIPERCGLIKGVRGDHHSGTPKKLFAERRKLPGDATEDFFATALFFTGQR